MFSPFMPIKAFKSSWFVTCLWLFAFFAPLVASAQGMVYLYVKTGTADVRLYPNATSDVVGTLPAGVTVIVSESRDGWYRVRLPKAETEIAARYGWIPADLIMPFIRFSDVEPCLCA